MFDYLIRGAEICDGTGAPRFRGDIGIANGPSPSRVPSLGRPRRLMSSQLGKTCACACRIYLDPATGGTYEDG
jgi:hypothetical protein